MPNDLQGGLLHAGIDISQGHIDFYDSQNKQVKFNGNLSSQIESTETVLTNAELLASNTTPIDLVAAPGAGKALIFHGAEWFLDYGSAAITADDTDDQVIAYDTGADVCLPIDSLLFIVLTADTHYYTPPVNCLVVANKALQFETQNSDLTDGTGSVLQIRCYYEIVTLQT